MSVTALRSTEAVCRAVVRCRSCPRLVEHREHVARTKRRAFRDWSYWGKPVPGFGDPDGRLLIVGLAPAAHGANRTGRMFTGDSSGDWLYDALHRFGFANQAESLARDDGLQLHDCYITAAARCAPPGNKPTKTEFENCLRYLIAEVGLLRRTTVTLVLGRLAHHWWLRATGLADRPPDDRPRFAHGATTRLADGRTLLASYHPSRQNTNTGRLTRPMWYDIFRTARRIVGAGTTR